MGRAAAVTGVALVAIGLIAAGCGYSTRSLHPEDVRTVVVPTFASREFRRELEFELTEELVKEIEAKTPYKVVHDRSAADTELRGEILDLDTPVVSEDLDTDRAIDVDTTLVCSFEWRDLRSGRVLARRSRISATGSFASAIGETLDSATTEATRHLAERIVEAMEEDW